MDPRLLAAGFATSPLQATQILWLLAAAQSLDWMHHAKQKWPRVLYMPGVADHWNRCSIIRNYLFIIPKHIFSYIKPFKLIIGEERCFFNMTVYKMHEICRTLERP